MTWIKDKLREHRAAVKNVMYTICGLLLLGLILYIFVPWRGEIYELDFLTGHDIYWIEYSDDEEEPFFHAYRFDDGTADTVYELLRSAKNTRVTRTEMRNMMHGERSVLMRDEDLSFLWDDSEDFGHLYMLYVRAGRYGYKISLEYINSEIGEYPIASISRGKIKKNLSDREFIRYMLTGFDGNGTDEVSQLDVDDNFELIELLDNYDKASAELAVEAESYWKLTQFG